MTPEETARLNEAVDYARWCNERHDELVDLLEHYESGGETRPEDILRLIEVVRKGLMRSGNVALFNAALKAPEVDMPNLTRWGLACAFIGGLMGGILAAFLLQLPPG